MNNLLNLLNVNNTFFTVFNYQMSYVEFFGTLLNIATVWLLVKKKILNWPVGIVAVILFGALFYQLHLYADLFEQVYYLLTGFWGWYCWAKAGKKSKDSKTDEQDKEDEIVVTRNSAKENIAWAIGIIVLTLVGTWAMSNIHLWLPKYFPEPASLPFLDVPTTVMSFAAQLLMIYKRLENWILWITVDIIAIGLYWQKGVPFVALLYVILLVLATNGYVTWKKTYLANLKGKLNDKRTGNRQILSAA